MYKLSYILKLKQAKLKNTNKFNDKIQVKDNLIE